MTLSVVVTRSAVKMYGSAFGIRTFRSTVPSDAAYDCISSSAAASTEVRPRTVLIIMGKNVISATIVMREAGLSELNQLFAIGAKAMIGIEFAAIATGRSDSRAVAQRDVAKAASSASEDPTRSPPSASVAVNTTPFWSVGH